jgi:magnesium transporter
MMHTGKIDLALSFLQSHADQAAAILEQQPMDQVAEFLTHVPLTQASEVMRKMLPQYAARLCKSLLKSTSAGLLAGMDFSSIVAIIRHSEVDSKKQLLGLLPDKTKIACRLLLNYPEDAAGAWMLTNITTLPDSCTVEEALARLVVDREATALDKIYVVNRARLIKGSVTSIDLLRATPNSLINRVMVKNPEAISARTSLISTANHQIWNLQDIIPLVNRNQQLVGVLKHADMRKGLNQIETYITPSDSSNPMNGIFEVYGHSLIALINAVAEGTHSDQPRRQ